MATLTELNVNRVSNIMSAQTSNTKRKEMPWPDYSEREIRVKIIESVIVEGWKFINYSILTAVFQNFFMNTFNTLK